ncbi:phosphodiester glycosidase family protein, partial [Elusimicrobiota bacterium]
HAGGKPEGLFVEEGRVHKNPSRQSKVFYVRKDGSTRFDWIRNIKDRDIAQMKSAVSGFHEGKRKSLTARTAICKIANGRIKLIVSFPIVDLDHMTEYIKNVEGCVEWVHLDGGGSSQMIYSYDKEFWIGFERNKNVLGDEIDPETDKKPLKCTKKRKNYPAPCWRPVTDMLVVVPRED